MLLSLACAGEANTRDAGDAVVSAADDGVTGTAITATGTATLTLTGPVMPGTHSASGEVLCFHSGTDWGATFEERTEDPTRVSAVIALVSGVGVQGGQSDQFNLSAMWGDPMHEHRPGGMAEVDTRQAPAGGTGTATVQRSGNSVTISLNARRPGGMTAADSTEDDMGRSPCATGRSSQVALVTPSQCVRN